MNKYWNSNDGKNENGENQTKISQFDKENDEFLEMKWIRSLLKLFRWRFMPD